MISWKNILIAAFLAAFLLPAAGCVPFSGQASEEEPVAFQAVALRLGETPTKAELKDAFTEGDTFSVYSEHTTADAKTLFLDNVTVTRQPDEWTYAPIKSWIWNSRSDYYDFVATYPAGRASKISGTSSLATSMHYDLSAPCELLAAACRRTGDVSERCEPVQLGFVHMTSAVDLVIINNSVLQKVCINAVRYQNLVKSGDAKATMDNTGKPLLTWINTIRRGGTARETTFPDAGQEIGVAARHALPTELMIPQRLDQAAAAGGQEADMPKLQIDYTPVGGNPTTAEILLKDIRRQDGSAITSWEVGGRYTYYIAMRLDGGVLVRIVTTGWEEIEAQTPGLLIQ